MRNIPQTFMRLGNTIFSTDVKPFDLLKKRRGAVLSPPFLIRKDPIYITGIEFWLP